MQEDDKRSESGRSAPGRRRTSETQESFPGATYPHCNKDKDDILRMVCSATRARIRAGKPVIGRQEAVRVFAFPHSTHVETKQSRRGLARNKIPTSMLRAASYLDEE